MVIRIAEGQADHGQALEVVGDIEFIHDAHAAVQLHRLLADEARRLRDVGLGGSHRTTARCCVRRVGTDCRQCRHRTGLFGRDHHVRHAVLQCLELANRLAELLARLEVFQRDFVQGRHDADGFGAERGIGVVDAAFDARKRVAGSTHQRVGADLHAGHFDVGGAGAVLRRIAAQREAGRTGVDQEQRQTLTVAGRHQKLVGRRCAQYHGLGAVELPAIAIGRGGGGDPVECVTAPGFMVGQRQHHFAAGDRRQQGFFLRLAAGIADHPTAEDHA